MSFLKSLIEVDPLSSELKEFHFLTVSGIKVLLNTSSLHFGMV
jgi:hypothetical protein